MELNTNVFQPSSALRWVKRKGSSVQGTEVVSCTFDGFLILQQEWVNPYTSEREWRDVPTVEEDYPK